MFRWQFEEKRQQQDAQGSETGLDQQSRRCRHPDEDGLHSRRAELCDGQVDPFFRRQHEKCKDCEEYAHSSGWTEERHAWEHCRVRDERQADKVEQVGKCGPGREAGGLHLSGDQPTR